MNALPRLQARRLPAPPLHVLPLLALLLSAPVAACVSSPRIHGAGDGGDSADAAAACDTCASDADCAGGDVCVPGEDGCTACAPPSGGKDGGISRCSTEACATGTECCTGYTCRSSIDPPACGTCWRVEDGCASNADCPDGHVCVKTEPPPCACEPRPVLVCRLHCRRGSCGPREHCADDGACRPVSCQDRGGYCLGNDECVGDGGDRFGCRPRTCVTASDCGGGFCIAGRCAPDEGRCELPVP